mmetsp:Transcript_32415/g.52478  ORF Transcript_32415/g.52478 Transcript_32415/m.52478 type:complete len:307 (+) Transcript_32415:153-1073(+)|eukprot:CAMPEP_0184643478 /NCGR_PEP_ID=MMETSP0308-20130426/336_1 /TAXON_ID=38269 /ORGANISM="Gloeochaete witrockiana, Strain SAG 46.84" /LENGTH=306 /DNA_ID=CAMNT_0027071449 /DNA_START=103 /DNA_END=1023 /DNA_ORIENTATION=-
MATGFATVGENHYGKSRVRVVRVFKRPDRHDIVEFNVNIQLYGDFETSYTEGSNEKVVATDSMKNMVYVIAKRDDVEQPEKFCLAYADHILKHYSHVSKVDVSIIQTLWQRIKVDGKDHHHAFSRGGSAEKRTASVVMNRNGPTELKGGIMDLIVLKTTQSGFEGFVRDKYTTLPEVKDRIFATSMTATWTFANLPRGTICFKSSYEKSRQALVETFAGPAGSGIYSPSVQLSMYQMGSAVLEKVPTIDSISIYLPNLHCNLINMAPFGLSNPQEIFVPTEEPHGAINATIVRKGLSATMSLRSRL